MKVLIIASWYPTPEQPLNGIFFQKRAQALARSGCEVSVAVADVRLRMGCKDNGLSIQRVSGVTEYRYLKRNITPFWEEGIAIQQISMIRKIYEQVCKDSGKPDIIHLESARCAYAAVRLAKKENIPLTYTEHYSGILNSRPGSFLDRTMRLAVNSAAHTFLISSAMKRRLNPLEENSSRLPNAIDFSDFAISQSAEPFTFCAMGALRSIKGYDVLLRAFGEVKKTYPDCKLEIGGDGPEKQQLIALRDELGLQTSVKFCGGIPIDRRVAFFDGKSAFICSSLTETFSMVLIEAFASGLPVVATKCGGPEDLVDEDNGYLVEKGNVFALAEGMIKMIKTRSRFDSAQIRKNAYFCYDETNVVAQQKECFKKLLGS